jgi:hypothetical protein
MRAARSSKAVATQNTNSFRALFRKTTPSGP